MTFYLEQVPPGFQTADIVATLLLGQRSATWSRKLTGCTIGDLGVPLYSLSTVHLKLPHPPFI